MSASPAERAAGAVQAARTWFDSFVLALAIPMLVFAPLMRGAKIPSAQLLLQCAALVLLVGLAWQRARWPRNDRLLLATLAVLVTAFLVPLVPLPPALWSALPGRAPIAGLLADLGMQSAWRPLSLSPSDSMRAALALLPPIALLLTVLTLQRSAVRTLVYVFLAMAAMESLIAMVQYPQGPHGALRFGMQYAESSGTYTNRNHLAGMLEMALPFAFALLVVELDRARKRSTRGTLLNALPLIHLALVVAILLGLVFSRSRAGLLLGGIGAIACAFVLRPEPGDRVARRTIARVVGIAALAALAVGVTPIVQRFATGGVFDASRVHFLANTLDAALAFLPFGSGPGSFEYVYPWFQPESQLSFFYVNEAHNDYAQALLEGGLLLAVALGLALWRLARGWRALSRDEHDPDVWRCMRRGAGISIALLLLHSTIDFNLQTPANALYFALCCAIFLREPNATERGSSPTASSSRLVAVSGDRRSR